MRHNFRRFVIATIACIPLLASEVSAQSPAHNFITVLQGKEVPIPADYVGKYEEQKKELLVSLDSLGLDPTQGEDVSVSLVRADGTSETQQANADGEYVFKEISSGLASVVVTGSKGTYAAMAVFVDSLAALAAADPAVPAPNAGELPPVPGRNPFQVPTILNLDKNEISRAVSSSGTGPQGASVKSLSFYKPAPASRFQVKLVNGTLQGKIVVPEDGYEQQTGQFNITILKFGKVVGATTSDADGNFFVKLQSSGVHSIIAAGPAGHAAFSFEVLDGGQTAAKNWKSSARLVATLPAPGETLFVLVIPPRMMPAVQQVVTQAYPTPPAPMADAGAPPMFAPGFPGGFAGGGFGGGGMGGGGAGGGGSGLGGGGGGGLGGGLGRLPIGAILGVGGLAAGVAALTSDDDGFTTTPASIIVP